MLGGENIHPQPDIGDNFFDFQLLQGKQFNFEDIFTATIVVDSDKYTYWKVERYVDNVLDRTYYFYTSRVLSILKSAFTLELSLDIYLTYTRNVINQIKTSQDPIKVVRGSITPQHLLNGDNAVYLKALKTIDSGVLGGDDSYVRLEPQKLIGSDTEGVADYNTFPYVSSKTTVASKSWVGPFDYPNVKYPAGHNGPYWWVPSGSSSQMYDLRFRSAFINGRWKVFRNKFYPSAGLDDKLPQWEVKEANDNIDKQYQIVNIRTNEMSAEVLKEVNQNIMNGYFAVFRNAQGFIDAYPLIGKIPVTFQVPAVCIGSAQATPLPATEQNHNTVGRNAVINRLYSNENTRIKETLHNDWDSIYEEYIKNPKDFYPGEAFQGIFRWLFPAHKKGNVTFILKEQDNLPLIRESDLPLEARPDGQNLTVKCRYTVPHRMCFRFTYSEVSEHIIRNERDSSKLFVLAKTGDTNIVDRYIELLQPIQIGNQEITPARYCFLGKKVRNVVGYTIPFSYAFLDGFKMFLQTVQYNNPSLSVTLGGTLPTVSSKYYRQIEAIEQQKNAGVASAVGNLIGRPLNWLSGGFSFGSQSGLNNSIRQSVGESFSRNLSYNAFWHSGTSGLIPHGTDPRTYSHTQSKNAGSDSILSRYNTAGSRGSANISGLGGFIGDFINIGTTLKKSEVAKRNVGPGYQTSLDEDLYGAVIHQSFIKSVSGLNPAGEGLYSLGAVKIFDTPTREKYKYFFNNFGFYIDELLPPSYIGDIINYSNTETGYFEIDKNWCLTNLKILSTYNDNVVRNAIIGQLSDGIRIRRFT